MIKYLSAAICAIMISSSLCLAQESRSLVKEPFLRAGFYNCAQNRLIGMEVNKMYGREIVTKLYEFLANNHYILCENQEIYYSILDTLKSTGGINIFVKISEYKAGDVIPSPDYLSCSIAKFIIKAKNGEIISGGNAVLLIPKQRCADPEIIKMIFHEITTEIKFPEKHPQD